MSLTGETLSIGTLRPPASGSLTTSEEFSGARTYTVRSRAKSMPRTRRLMRMFVGAVSASVAISGAAALVGADGLAAVGVLAAAGFGSLWATLAVRYFSWGRF